MAAPWVVLFEDVDENVETRELRGKCIVLLRGIVDGKSVRFCGLSGMYEAQFVEE